MLLLDSVVFVKYILSGFEVDWTKFHFYKMRTVKNPNPLYSADALLRKGAHHTSAIVAFFVSCLNIFLSPPSHFDFLSHIYENNPCVSSASMNSDSRGPQIAAAELFVAQFYILQI